MTTVEVMEGLTYYNASEYNLQSNYTTEEGKNEKLEREIKYISISCVLIFLCVVAAVINVRILISVKWIPRPLSSTLNISLSLALADVCIAVLLGTGILINSLLPIGLNIEVVNSCVIITIEAFRLSGILVTVIHLLALAGNHYLGIRCPLRSRSWITPTNTTVVIVFIWVAPTAYIFVYFSIFKNQGYQAPSCFGNETYTFITEQPFRRTFSTIFFIPLLLMFFIYFHISFIVRKHQRGKRWYGRHSRKYDNNKKGNRSYQQVFDRNLKATWTTLLILSTYLICFMPVVLLYYLLCDDCYFSFSQVDVEWRLILGSTSNLLLIIKPLLNPLIYASRMKEIRAATKKMNAHCRRIFCPFVSTDELDRNCSSATDMSHPKFSFVSTSMKKNQCSISSVHLDNGFASKSARRRATDTTTDL